MKTLVVAAALAALAASPALAAPHSARTASSDYDAAYGGGYDAYAAYGTPGAFGNSPAVIFNNQVVGQDPDPNVRLMLEKDPGLQAY